MHQGLWREHQLFLESNPALGEEFKQSSCEKGQEHLVSIKRKRDTAQARFITEVRGRVFHPSFADRCQALSLNEILAPPAGEEVSPSQCGHAGSAASILGNLATESPKKERKRLKLMTGAETINESPAVFNPEVDKRLY